MQRAKAPVALITGVSAGIGLATAQALVTRGWIVVGTIRGRKRPAGLRPGEVDLQPAEMTRQGDLERIVVYTWRTYGRIDALICNAGYGLIGPIDSLDYAQMKDQLAVNTLAPAELIALTVPLMRRQGSGVIVAISSIVGRTGIAGYSLYSASKHALEGLFESLDLELAGTNIRLRLIEPSSVNTSFWADLRRGANRRWGAREIGRRAAAEPAQSNHGLTADQVAAAVVKAVLAPGRKLHYPLGQTRLVVLGRRLLPDWLYRWILRKVIM